MSTSMEKFTESSKLNKIVGTDIYFNETINNNTVTLRNRDTMEQITLNVNEVASYINEKIRF